MVGDPNLYKAASVLPIDVLDKTIRAGVIPDEMILRQIRNRTDLSFEERKQVRTRNPSTRLWLLCCCVVMFMTGGEPHL